MGSAASHGSHGVGESPAYGMPNGYSQKPARHNRNVPHMPATQLANCHSPYSQQQYYGQNSNGVAPYPPASNVMVAPPQLNINQSPGMLPYPTTPGHCAMPVPSQNSENDTLNPTQPSIDASSSEDSGTEPDMGEVSENRDRIYMVVLSADEFLGRMSETDSRIHSLSQAQERELHMKSIQDSLGLRGHLQDELLRIEQMLSKEDPKLRCLRSFKQTFPGVVRTLRNIRKRQRLIEENAVQIDLPTVTTAPVQTETEHRGDGVTTAVQAGGMGSQFSDGAQAGAGLNQSTSMPQSDQVAMGTSMVDVQPQTEDDLNKQHDEEERLFAAKYAHKLVDRSRVTSDDVNKMLSEHALGMQALRNRQDGERQKWKDLVQRKTKERLKKRRKKKGDEASDDSDTADVSETLSKPLLSPIQSNTATHSENHPSQLPPLQAASNPNVSMYGDDFEMDSDEEKVVEKKTTDAMWRQMSLKHRTTAQDLQSMMQTIQEEESIKTRTDNQTQTSTELESDLLKEVKQQDYDFVEKLRRKARHGAISDADFARLINSHLENNQRLRELQNNEKRKHNSRLKSKLAKKKKGKNSNNEPNSSENGQDDTDEEVQDSETIGLLSSLEQEFKQDVLKRKDELTEDDIARLLNEYRRKQLLIIKQRKGERDRLDGKLKARLDARNKQNQGGMEQIVHGTADDDFWLQLQDKQTSGDLTKEEFAQLLESYMHKQKYDRKFKLEGEATDQEKASELLKQHEKETKRLQGLLKAEKDKTDQRLKSRLAAKKKKKKQIYDEDSDDEL